MAPAVVYQVLAGNRYLCVACVTYRKLELYQPSAGFNEWIAAGTACESG